MKTLLEAIRGIPRYDEILESAQVGEKIAGLGLPRAARLPMLASLYQELRVPILFLTDRADRALTFADELSFWTQDAPRYLFSQPNPAFYEEAAWGATNRRERIQALTALAAYHLPFVDEPASPPIIISSALALMARTLPRREFLKASKVLKVGKEYLLTPLLEHAVKLGYQPVSTVLAPGEFAHRGGLLDLWVPSDEHPIRLDFFGDELDAIKTINPVSQRTMESLPQVLLTPAREFLLPDVHDTDADYAEFHIPRLHPFPASLLDYLPSNALIFFDDLSMIERAVHEIDEQAVALRKENIAEEILDEDFPPPYLTWAELEDRLHGKRTLALGYSTADIEEPALFESLPHFSGRLKPFMAFLAEQLAGGEEIVVASRQSDRLMELWQERYSFKDEETLSPTFLSASLAGGWRIDFAVATGRKKTGLSLLTDAEIFGWERPRPRRRRRKTVDAPEAAYADLSPGDWVVHIDHGIGKYTGLVQRSLEGYKREFLRIEYKDNDLLFVPVHQADRLTRYVGADSGNPAMGRLGGEQWKQVKGRVRRAVEDVAEDLLELYARRKIAQGFSFQPDSAWQRELESSFPYVETEDQLCVLEEVKQDMEASRPMDRLLCGDVGYGKTEVALRAAFKAVMSGKQVAILAPTTVLVQQHFDTFQQRLSAFPVKVEMLSRFRSPRAQSKILFGLAQGGVDIIIGTHRLLSGDVFFKDLGLIIVDEEQRFGVAHKEHLKKMRAEVDVLTMTATPIPRTLYMALTGVRDISTLNTPPEERLPIMTHVGPYSPKLVRRAVLREMDRGGQVFFVHNRVQTIQAMKSHLQKLVPEARIAVGHGQMPKGELSKVMSSFVAGKVDVLLSTTIIESGLDIPNANTLIVDRGDTFGLAQLYQLRGRVGRGAVRAYAYFFRHRKKIPTEEGRARLEVIAENAQLGAGYSIAMRDLEIRGAGDLLGTRQHGYIASVGFHLYTRLLSEAVTQARARTSREPAALPAFKPINLQPVNVEFPFAVGIPADYIPDGALRLRLYRRLANIPDEEGLDDIQIEFADRFGDLPEMVENLFFQIAVKLRAEDAGLAAVTMSGKKITLQYPPLPDGKTRRPLRDLGLAAVKGKNAYFLTTARQKNWRARLLNLLARLSEA